MLTKSQWLVIDPETGKPSEPWGFQWASKAAEAGALQAAAPPLPGDDEATAHEFARDILSDAPSAREWARNVAETSARLAKDSYRTYRRRVRELRASKSQKDQLVLNANLAAIETERWGRFAAQWNRVHLLVERGAGQ